MQRTKYVENTFCRELWQATLHTLVRHEYMCVCEVLYTRTYVEEDTCMSYEEEDTCEVLYTRTYVYTYNVYT